MVWAVAVPLFALAVLRPGALPRCIGWLGLFVGLVGGWIGACGIVSTTVEDITAIGFLAFVVWMLAMGIALLRAPRGHGAEAASVGDTVTA